MQTFLQFHSHSVAFQFPHEIERTTRLRVFILNPNGYINVRLYVKPT
jgi:hypothetical protein